MDPHHRTNRQTWEFHGGEILGVTLFLVAINGILGELRNGVNGSLFADDLARPLQGVTNKLHAWAVERGLSFSTSKKVNIVFRKRRKRNKEPMEITLRNKIIPNEESTQFLGMSLDSGLNWEEHIESETES